MWLGRLNVATVELQCRQEKKKREKQQEEQKGRQSKKTNNEQNRKNVCVIILGPMVLDLAAICAEYWTNVQNHQDFLGKEKGEKIQKGKEKKIRALLGERKMRTNFFCTNFFNTLGVRDVPAKFPGHPRFLSSKPKGDKLSLEGKNFRPPLLRMEDPHPIGRSPDPKS